ncbi:hypothetical protein HEP87_64665 [Streptomyces sp. S1D4-11]
MQPTLAQRQINALRGAVCWLAEDTLLIPYGGHNHQHAAREGEDWSGDMASWRHDWRISRPRPAGEADWWGLVPYRSPLSAAPLTKRLAAALQVMADLAHAEQGRERHRRRLARNHTQHSTVRSRPPQQLQLPTADEARSEPAPPHTAVTPTTRSETTEVVMPEPATARAAVLAVAPTGSLPRRAAAAPERPAKRRSRFSWLRLLSRRRRSNGQNIPPAQTEG